MLRASLSVVGLLCLSMGCASTRAVAPPIATDAALGRIVVYRNGVAYFERHARIQGNSLKLEVPGARLDDFLKSLTVVDTKTNELVPISFPTLDDEAREVTITLGLPERGTHDLKITYVTESPSWKPSYRLSLRGERPARLEAWAVVHNVSGENWNKVAIGVGSSSALSFRYDLRSVHFVDRVTLVDQTELGVAPPTGGSPYRVAANEVQILGAVKVGTKDAARSAELDEEAGARAVPSSRAARGGSAAAPARPGRGYGYSAEPSDGGLGLVAKKARATRQKIRVEGYARGDACATIW
jgi:hypothetical protein